MEIRTASLEDLPGITEIYNEAILNTTATFDLVPKTAAEQAIWFGKHNQTCPIVVALVDKQVLGWASLSAWSDRGGYSQTGEVSFYVRERCQGKGIGRALLSQLDREAQRLNYHTLISRIAGESKVSLHLHESFGFQYIGVMKEVGRKFGRLQD